MKGFRKVWEPNPNTLNQGLRFGILGFGSVSILYKPYTRTRSLIPSPEERKPKSLSPTPQSQELVPYLGLGLLGLRVEVAPTS